MAKTEARAVMREGSEAVELDINAFLAADFDGRIRLVNETSGERLWSFQLAEVWADVLDYLKRSSAPMPSSQRQLMRELIALAPDTEMAETAWRTWIDDVDRAALPTPPSIVHLMLSCEKYKAKAILHYESLAAQFSPIYILLGDPTQSEAVFDGPFLKVPAADNYESLTWKILEGLIAVRRRFGRVGVLKFDDDTILSGPQKPDQIVECVTRSQYAGYVVGGPDLDRCWHAGKCEHVGDSPYRRRFRGPWVGGRIYYLGPDAVDYLVREALFFPGEFEGEIFEDKAVGDTLRRHGILPEHRDLSDAFGIAIAFDTPPRVGPLAIRRTDAREDNSSSPPLSLATDATAMQLDHGDAPPPIVCPLAPERQTERVSVYAEESGVTAVLTSCGRPDLLERTLMTFFAFNTCPLDRFIVVEDGPRDANLALMRRFEDRAITWIGTERRAGQIEAIDLAYSLVETRWIFHLEDDWEFYAPGFIEKSREVLEADPTCLQVWLRALDDTNGHPLLPDVESMGGVEIRRLIFDYLAAWHGFSFNPGLRRTADYRAIGSYSRFVRFDPHDRGSAESGLSQLYKSLGMYAVILADNDGKGYVRHIGWERTVPPG